MISKETQDALPKEGVMIVMDHWTNQANGEAMFTLKVSVTVPVVDDSLDNIERDLVPGMIEQLRHQLDSGETKRVIEHGRGDLANAWERGL
jgi:hypothetical protein